MAKQIEEFTLKNGGRVTVYDLGNYSFEFLIQYEGSQDHKFTLHDAQAGIGDGDATRQKDEQYSAEEKEAITIFRQIQDKKGF